MRRMYLTFDYEPFLGRWSGTAQRSVLLPTAAILDTLAAAGVERQQDMAATFFVDVTWLLRLQHGSAAHLDTLMLVGAQLLRMLSDGHQIGLHLHPSWLDAEPKDDGWHIPEMARYRMDQLSVREAGEIIRSGVALLHELVRPSFPDFTVRWYRAGGLCAQPFEGTGVFLAECGITGDSSVAAGMWAHSSTHRYDYRTAPTTCTPWMFRNNPANAETEGPFTEYPIAVFHPRPLPLIFNKMARMLRSAQHKGSGDGQPSPPGTIPGITQKLAGVVCPEPRCLSLEQATPHFFDAALRQVNGDDVVVLSHPKFATPGMHELIRHLARRRDLIFLALGTV